MRPYFLVIVKKKKATASNNPWTVPSGLQINYLPKISYVLTAYLK
jgi:hypothetical protein